ncbi:ATP-binding protein [Deinococcus sonorensis]|uniref:ATP-binding protein n=2 Tax=Deinococcus sonorensis TaxID=309891 RepID=A0AAU7UBP5_9DEIO
MNTGTVHLIYGPQGAGKSTLAAQLAREHGAVSFSIDEWMKRLYLPDLTPATSLEWVLERTRRCEGLIWSVCLQVLPHGTDVVLDLGPLRREDRQRLRALAQTAGVAVQAHFVDAQLDERRRRVFGRNQQQGENSAFAVSPEMFALMEGQFGLVGRLELALSRPAQAAS